MSNLEKRASLALELEFFQYQKFLYLCIQLHILLAYLYCMHNEWQKPIIEQAYHLERL